MASEEQYWKLTSTHMYTYVYRHTFTHVHPHLKAYTYMNACARIGSQNDGTEARFPVCLTSSAGTHVTFSPARTKARENPTPTEYMPMPCSSELCFSRRCLLCKCLDLGVGWGNKGTKLNLSAKPNQKTDKYIPGPQFI